MLRGKESTTSPRVCVFSDRQSAHAGCGAGNFVFDERCLTLKLINTRANETQISSHRTTPTIDSSPWRAARSLRVLVAYGL
eukprot:2663821-Prymnesium_polylepis.1